jgi:hypothetical protein
MAAVIDAITSPTAKEASVMGMVSSKPALSMGKNDSPMILSGLDQSVIVSL